MPLNEQDQINLLKDIINNHQMDCCGSVSDCEQLERLIKSLMVNNNINHNVKNILEEIYNYSQTGIYTNNLDHHIESHQQQLSQWVTDMNQFS